MKVFTHDLLDRIKGHHDLTPPDPGFWDAFWTELASSISDDDQVDLAAAIERWDAQRKDNSEPASTLQAPATEDDPLTPEPATTPEQLHRRRRTRKHAIPELKLPEGFRIPEDAEPYVQQQHIRLLYRDAATGKKRWKWLHRVVWEWANGPVPEGMLIHHIDGNPVHNALENLQCMSRADHSRLHRLNPHLRSAGGAEYYARNKPKNQRACRAYYLRRKGIVCTAQPDGLITTADSEQDRLEREVREHMAKMKASRRSTDAESSLPGPLDLDPGITPTEEPPNEYTGKENDMCNDTNPPTEAAPPRTKPSVAETIAIAEAFLAEHCPKKAGPFPPRMPEKRGRTRKSKTVASV